MGANPIPQKEDNLQMQIVTYCRHKKILMFAPINENKWAGVIRQMLIGTIGKARGLATASKIISKIVIKNRKMGQKKGVTDLIVLLDGGITLFIELKTATGKQSEDQKTFGSDLTKRGHIGYICRSMDDFIQIIANHT